jgi:hypothetical protein
VVGAVYNGMVGNKALWQVRAVQVGDSHLRKRDTDCGTTWLTDLTPIFPMGQVVVVLRLLWLWPLYRYGKALGCLVVLSDEYSALLVEGVCHELTFNTLYRQVIHEQVAR